jgi:hypothetical protein
MKSQVHVSGACVRRLRTSSIGAALVSRYLPVEPVAKLFLSNQPPE